MAYHNDFGKEAEDIAAAFLLENGYQIITRNFCHQRAEIDIIAKKNHIYCIVEVKARSTDVVIQPQEAVNRKKMKLIISAADAFIQENQTDCEVRFDIITVLRNGQNGFKINHIKNAFEAADGI